MLAQSGISSRDAAYVFVSYAHVDRQMVRPYVLKLKEHDSGFGGTTASRPARSGLEPSLTRLLAAGIPSSCDPRRCRFRVLFSRGSVRQDQRIPRS